MMCCLGKGLEVSGNPCDLPAARCLQRGDVSKNMSSLSTQLELPLGLGVEQRSHRGLHFPAPLVPKHGHVTISHQWDVSMFYGEGRGPLLSLALPALPSRLLPAQSRTPGPGGGGTLSDPWKRPASAHCAAAVSGNPASWHYAARAPGTCWYGTAANTARGRAGQGL